MNYNKRLLSSLLTVKTPPIMAHTLVMKCEKDLEFSVMRTCNQKKEKDEQNVTNLCNRY